MKSPVPALLLLCALCVQTGSGRRRSKCERELAAFSRDMAGRESEGEVIDQYHEPECMKDGGYKPEQTFGGAFGTYTFCVDKRGKEIRGTHMGIEEKRRRVPCDKVQKKLAGRKKGRKRVKITKGKGRKKKGNKIGKVQKGKHDREITKMQKKLRKKKRDRKREKLKKKLSKKKKGRKRGKKKRGRRKKGRKRNKIKSGRKQIDKKRKGRRT